VNRPVDLPLADEVKEAILRGAGPEGELLRGVVAWEKGAFGAIHGRCTRGTRDGPHRRDPLGRGGHRRRRRRLT